MSAPDWEFWSLVTFVKDWQAAALSIGLDPDSIQEKESDSWSCSSGTSLNSVSFRDESLLELFNKRWRLVMDWVQTHGHDRDNVNLPDFAAWATENHLDVPAEFAELAGKGLDGSNTSGIIGANKTISDVSEPTANESQSIAEDKDTCDFAELVRNGEPINWPYWLDRKSITPAQGAKLAHCIDPIKWPDEAHEQGPFSPDLREKIQRMTEWLADIKSKWTLASLVEVLGNNAPYLMRVAVTGNDGEEKSLPTANWILLVQVEAAKRWIVLRGAGASPTKLSLVPELVTWCAEKKIKTKTGVAVTAENLYKFALLPWNPPADDSESSESSETET